MNGLVTKLQSLKARIEKGREGRESINGHDGANNRWWLTIQQSRKKCREEMRIEAERREENS